MRIVLSPWVILVAAIVLCLATTYDAAAELVTNPSFETPEDTFIYGFPGLPSAYGDWGGDLSAIAATENGIVPRTATHMLRFDATGNTADPQLNSSQIYQLIDVSAYAGWIAQGKAQANVEAWFNRVTGDAQTDTGFSVAIIAFSGNVANYANDWMNGQYLSAGFGLLSDGNTATWESASGNWLLPTDTTYLVVALTASENIKNDGTYPEFDGHYADDISLTITEVPEPSCCIMALGGLLCSMAFAVLRKKAR